MVPTIHTPNWECKSGTARHHVTPCKHSHPSACRNPQNTTQKTRGTTPRNTPPGHNSRTDRPRHHHVTDSHGRIDRQRHRRPRPYSQPHTTARVYHTQPHDTPTHTPHPPREGYPRARRRAAATLALPLDAIWGYYGKTVRFCGECCSFTFSSLQRLPQRLL